LIKETGQKKRFFVIPFIVSSGQVKLLMIIDIRIAVGARRIVTETA
jgi:hypothetical protein